MCLEQHFASRGRELVHSTEEDRQEADIGCVKSGVLPEVRRNFESVLVVVLPEAHKKYDSVPAMEAGRAVVRTRTTVQLRHSGHMDCWS